MKQTTRKHNPDLLSIDFVEDAAEYLKVMAHPARLRMVDILLQGEYPVHRIAELCDLQPHQACEHLRLLKGHGLLDSERRGRTVYYRVTHPRLPKLLKCLRASCRDE